MSGGGAGGTGAGGSLLQVGGPHLAMMQQVGGLGPHHLSDNVLFPLSSRVALMGLDLMSSANFHHSRSFRRSARSLGRSSGSLYAGGPGQGDKGDAGGDNSDEGETEAGMEGGQGRAARASLQHSPEGGSGRGGGRRRG